MNTQSTAHVPEWTLKAFEALSAAELHAILAARAQVFVVEQHCAYLDVDGLDLWSWHLWSMDQTSAPAAVGAYLRILPPGVRYPDCVAMGRVLTSAARRGQGWGRALIAEGVRVAAEQWPAHDIKLGAQLHLQALYGEFGFQVCGPGFIEDGIPHIEMRRTHQA